MVGLFLAASARPRHCLDLFHAEPEELLHRNVQRFRGGLVVKAHRLCVSLNSRLQSNSEEEGLAFRDEGLGLRVLG